MLLFRANGSITALPRPRALKALLIQGQTLPLVIAAVIVHIYNFHFRCAARWVGCAVEFAYHGAAPLKLAGVQSEAGASHDSAPIHLMAKRIDSRPSKYLKAIHTITRKISIP